MKLIGKLKTKSSDKTEKSRIGIGFECYDRDLYSPEKCYDLAAATGAKGDMDSAQNICRNIIKQLRDIEDDYVFDFDFYLLYRRLKVTFGFATHVFSSVAEDT